MPLIPEERARIFGDPIPPEQPREMRTCDCPIVFPENPAMASQAHRYDCPLGRQMSLAAIRKRFEVDSWDSADLAWLYHRAETWPKMLKTLEGAYHCIKSYEYGNASPDLAQEWAAELEAAIRDAEGDRNVSK